MKFQSSDNKGFWKSFHLS